tara:strand:- start:15910 stop:16011 length:102 start_codon:yes stop_codon:yes gene_type:complete
MIESQLRELEEKKGLIHEMENKKQQKHLWPPMA